ncbi:hypothetical protein P4050_16555 [Pseudomonas aeruginosa]|nr:hypothetical protein [Pseudomonas aeruginosa]
MFVLSAYNGGQGWVTATVGWLPASGADQLAWFDPVERFNAGRSAANFRENRNYPRLILLRHERIYLQGRRCVRPEVSAGNAAH